MQKVAKIAAILMTTLILVPFESAYSAITFSISGDVAFDKESISMEVTISGIDPADLLTGGSTTDYKNNLAVILPAAGSDTPIRTTLGSDTIADTVNDFFWDKANSGVSIEDQSSDSIELKYTFKIYNNTSQTDPDTISSLLAQNSPESISIEIEFWAIDNSDGTYSQKSTSDTVSLSVNYAVVNSEVALNTVTSVNKGIRVSWTSADTVSYSDGNTRIAPEVLLTVFKFENSDIDLSAASFLADTETGADSNSGTCRIDAALVGTTTGCVIGCTNSADDQIFLEDTAMANLKTAGTLAYSGLIDPDETSLDISGLDVGDTYAAFLQYKRGVAQSTCLTAVVTENTTLTEFNGEEDAELKNPACYIATAAYGSSLHPKLDTFRWFRNNYLLTNTFGRKFVELYYKHSPQIADTVAKSPVLKSASLAMLYPLSLTIESLQVFGPLVTFLMISGFMSLCLLGFFRMRKSTF